MTTALAPDTAVETPGVSEDSVETTTLAQFEAALTARLEAGVAIETTDAEGNKTVNSAVKSASVALRRAYSGLDKTDKTSARNRVKEVQAEAVFSDEFAKAKAAYNAQEEILKPIGAKGRGTGGAAKDRTEDAANLGAVLAVAYSLHTLRSNADSEVRDEWFTSSQALATEALQNDAIRYADWLDAAQEGVEPDVSDLAKAAARVSLGRSPKGSGRKPGSGKAAGAASAEDAADVEPTDEELVAE